MAVQTNATKIHAFPPTPALKCTPTRTHTHAHTCPLTCTPRADTPPPINLYDCLPSLHVNLLLDTEQTVAASEELVDELAKAEARIEQYVLLVRWPESKCEP